MSAPQMGSVIESLCPKALILGMLMHKKGPVFTASMAYEHIKDDEPVIVAYCDGAIVRRPLRPSPRRWKSSIKWRGIRLCRSGIAGGSPVPRDNVCRYS